MERKFSLLATIFLLFFSFPAVWALEISAGNLTLALYEDSGRFNLFYRPPGSSAPTALLSPRDPASSAVSLVIGNNIRTMGGNSEFKQQTEATPLGARFIWTSPEVRIIQEFQLISEGGVRIILSLENVSERNLALGAAFLFDTWLGENGTDHFSTSAAPRLSQETAAGGAQAISYWVSGDPAAGVALRVVTAGSGVTPPDLVVFANWKRLYENMWNFKSATGASWSASPYSFNDSAVGQYYNPVLVRKGDFREITLLLGNSSSPLTAEELERRVVQEKTREREQHGPEATPAPAHDDRFILTMEKVQIMNNLLAEIDTKLMQGESYSSADFERLKTLLEEINKNPNQ
ncbi:MAG TPA: hypothetical protein ENN69_05345, partial [Spirochaetia bacterium]|nr:hypothetical protein [Spirochaetia bacterium]